MTLPIHLTSGNELLNTERKPREYILDQMIGQGELVMLYAPSGVGKSYIAINLAAGISTGNGYLDFPCLKPQKVLYVDAEMGKEDVQERIHSMMSDQDLKDLNFVFPSSFENDGYDVPNLASKKGQTYYEALAKATDTKVIVFDNLNTVARPEGHMVTEFQMWDSIEPWFKKLREEGYTIILIHHTNKGGTEQSGSQRKENLMSVCLNVKRSRFLDEFDKGKHAYEIHFKKQRRGGHQDPIYIQQEYTPVGVTMEHQSLHEKLSKEVIKAAKTHGVKYPEHKFKINKYDVQRIMKEHEDQTLSVLSKSIDPKNYDYDNLPGMEELF